MPPTKPYSEAVRASRRAARQRYRERNPEKTRADNRARQHDLCACGREKRKESKRCQACAQPRRTPDEKSVYRRDYQREYMRERRAKYRARRIELELMRPPKFCVDCGVRICSVSTRCRTCSAGHLGRLRAKPLGCVCGGALRPMRWHDQLYARCTQCGLEIRPDATMRRLLREKAA